VDDEVFLLSHATLLSFERVLDMQAGTLNREVLWETPSGKRVLIQSQRLVSFQHRHLAAISYQVTVQNAEAPVVISSEIIGNQPNQSSKGDPRQARGFAESVLLPKLHHVNDRRLMFCRETQNSQLMLVCGIDHAIETTCPYRDHPVFKSLFFYIILGASVPSFRLKAGNYVQADCKSKYLAS
jgi:alpha,alpha-trehalose phosphorylase